MLKEPSFYIENISLLGLRKKQDIVDGQLHDIYKKLTVHVIPDEICQTACYMSAKLFLVIFLASNSA